MNEVDVETIFNNYENIKKEYIKKYKNLVEKEEQNFIISIKQNIQKLYVIMSILYGLKISFDKIDILSNNAFNENCLSKEVSLFIEKWSKLDIMSQNIFNDLPYLYETIYVSKERNWIDASSLIVENIKENIYLKIFSVEFDSVLNNINVIFTNTNKYFELIRDIDYDYIQYDDNTRIIFPLNFVFLVNDEIYINFKSSFYYRELERAHVGRKYTLIEKGIIEDWKNIFKENISLNVIDKAYFETNKIKEELENII